VLELTSEKSAHTLLPMENEEEIVVILEQHIQSARNHRCICGWRPVYTAANTSSELFPQYRQHREHVAAMIVGTAKGKL
jgi:hypothetical protein